MPASRRSRGEGAFHVLPDGRIKHSISLGFDAEGKRLRPTVYGKTKVECRALMAGKLEEIRKLGGVPIADDTTLGEWLTQWLERKRLEPVAAQTHRGYDIVIRLHIAPRIGRIRLDKLRIQDVDRWLASLQEAGIGSRTCQYARTTLVVALNDAMRLELVDRNVASLVRAPRHEREEFPVWDIDEALKFLEAAREDRFHAFWVLWLTMGPRPHELLGLRPEDVDLSAGEIRITKQLHRGARAATKTPTARRTLPLTPFAIEAMREHKARLLADGLRASPWLFPATTGGPMGYRNLIGRNYEDIIKAAKVKRIRPYDLRHTYATLALKAGVPVKVVSESLGHRNIELTLRTYAHILSSMREEHVERIQSLFGGATHSPTNNQSSNLTVAKSSDSRHVPA